MNYLMRGLMWLPKRELRLYIFIPLLVNFILFSLLIYFGWNQFEHLLIWLQNWLPSWLAWLRWLLWPIFIVAAIIFLVYGFTFLANIVAAPFNGFLSARVEFLLTGQALPSRSLWHEIGYAFKMQMQLLAYFLVRALLFLLLLIIPVVQIGVPLLWMVFSAWMMALQYLDYPAENHYLNFKQLRQQLAQQRIEALGFGGSVMLLSMVPVLNFFIMPAAVIGATMWWVEQQAR